MLNGVGEKREGEQREVDDKVPVVVEVRMARTATSKSRLSQLSSFSAVMGEYLELGTLLLAFSVLRRTVG